MYLYKQLIFQNKHFSEKNVMFYIVQISFASGSIKKKNTLICIYVFVLFYFETLSDWSI